MRDLLPYFSPPRVPSETDPRIWSQRGKQAEHLCPAVTPSRRSASVPETCNAHEQCLALSLNSDSRALPGEGVSPTPEPVAAREKRFLDPEQDIEDSSLRQDNRLPSRVPQHLRVRLQTLECR